MTQITHTPEFHTRLAQSPADLIAAQELRYEVFVAELGASGAGVDHSARRETDVYDPHFDHLMLWDMAAPDGPALVGVYRLLRCDQRHKVGQFYTASEYDLSPLETGGRRLLELGRSCIAAPYRRSAALYFLWSALADYIEEFQIDVLFGVASFHGTDVASLAPSLSLLHARHLAPIEIRPRAVPHAFQPMDLIAPDQISRVQAMAQVPALIKGYLKLGGMIGEGAYVDHAFNTTDVCIVMDTARVNWEQARLFTQRRLE